MKPLSARRWLPSLLAATASLAPLAAQGPGQPPPPLSPPPAPPQNPVTPAKAVLGKMLFWEEQLSSNNRVACATCHTFPAGGGDLRRAPHPGLDGTLGTPDDTFGSPGVHAADANNDYRPAGAFDFHEQVTGRASPSALMGGFFPLLFWDGRASSTFTDPVTNQVLIPQGGALESQSLGPILSNSEMAHDGRTWGEVVQKLQASRPLALATNLTPDLTAALQQHGDYPGLFAAAFGTPAITPARIAFAIASYERTLAPDQTPWDQLGRGVPGALTPAQQQGLNLFVGPARCVICHGGSEFSDRGFHNLGLRPIAQDRGRQAITNNPADRGRFKTPSLRNVGLRTSFFHAGGLTTLQQVVAFYNGGGGNNLDNKDPALIPLGLSPLQQAQLIDFVQNGLTDPRVAQGLPPFDRPTLRSASVPPEGFRFGPARAGSGGIVPQMLAGVPANLGNVDFKVGVGDGRGGDLAVFALAQQAALPGANIQGVPVNVDVWVTAAFFSTTLGGAPGVPGAGFATIRHPLPAAPALSGMVLFGQWFLFDDGVAVAAATQGAQLRLF